MMHVCPGPGTFGQDTVHLFPVLTILGTTDAPHHKIKIFQRDVGIFRGIVHWLYNLHVIFPIH